MATKSRSSSTKASSSSKRSNSAGGSKRSSSSKGSSNGPNAPGASRDEEVERFRQAAEDALQQLDWTIGYLHGIKKTEISKALAQNRTYIRRSLMGEPDEGLPTQKTDET
jgi:hypothetical protein